MLKAKRIDDIIEILENDGVVNVNELSSRFGVTPMTIRRDLDVIESREKIQRIHGGALYTVNQEKENEIPSLNRMSLFKEEKIKIARKACEFIKQEETIFLGSGTTTFFLAKELDSQQNITVVTNSVLILNELATNSQIDVLMVGGFLRRAEYSLIGNFATDMISNLHVDKVFIGMRGIHPKFGLTSNHPEEIMTDKMILGMTSEVYVLADQSKIGQVAASCTDHIKTSHTIITSDKAAQEIVDAIKRQGVNVIQV